MLTLEEPQWIRTHTQQGAHAAFIASLTIGLVVTLGFAFDAAGRVPGLPGAEGYLDSFYYSICGIALQRKSPHAAIALLIPATSGLIIGLLTLNRTVILSLVLLFFFARALRAARTHQQFRETHRRVGKWEKRRGLFFSGDIFLGGFLYVAGIISVNFGPPHFAVTGSEVKPREVEFLIARGVIDRTETIELLYASGLFSLAEGGTILTNGRVLVFGKSNGATWVEDVMLSDVLDIRVINPPDLFSEGDVAIYKKGGGLVFLDVPVDGINEKSFIEAIRLRSVQ